MFYVVILNETAFFGFPVIIIILEVHSISTFLPVGF